MLMSNKFNNLMADGELLVFTPDARVDTWYHASGSFSKYPVLGLMVRACLSIFHGPQVESSFNTMGDILSTKSSSMKIDTFYAIQTVKYWMNARGKTATTAFEPTVKLVNNVSSAASQHKVTRKLRKREEGEVQSNACSEALI